MINGLCYIAWSLASRHLQRDLAMQKRDWRDIPRAIADHLRFRHPSGDEAARYNPLQKLAYLGVIFVLTPLIILTGLSMSPQMDTVLGWFLQLVGGRQSAVGTHPGFRGDDPVRAVRRGARGDGGLCRAGQRTALDDHRTLPGALPGGRSRGAGTSVRHAPQTGERR